MECTVTFQPHNKRLKVRPGTSVLEAARRAGIHIPTRCGGKMGCLMCKVQIPPDEKGCLPPKEAERRKLGALIHQGTRLSCQSIITGDLQITIPEDPFRAAVRKQLEAARNRDQEDFI